MASEDPTTRRNEQVRLVPHDPAWEARFAEEAALLRATIDPWIVGGIHHVGSTAVPGLDAKPVIDIAVGVESLEASRPCIELLSRIGYLHAPYLETQMHWFCKPDPGRRTHHLHLMPTGSTQFEDEILFRDYLRSHPVQAAAYGNLKRGLAAQHSDDRDAYTSAKTDFVVSTLAEARAWRRESTRDA